MAQAKERRRRQRIDVALPIKIEYNKEKISGNTKNISILGTYLETDKQIPIGNTLNIRINTPKKQICCTGVAFRSVPTGLSQNKKQYGTAIFFRSFLKTGEKDLNKYIAQLLSQEKKIGRIYMRKKRKKHLKQRGGE